MRLLQAAAEDVSLTHAYRMPSAKHIKIISVGSCLRYKSIDYVSKMLYKYELFHRTPSLLHISGLYKMYPPVFLGNHVKHGWCPLLKRCRGQ